MKNTLLALALLVSVPALAQSVYVRPVIFNFGNSIQVQIHNTTDKDLNCNGTVMMNTRSNRSETAFYNDYIYRGSVSTRMFYLMNNQDQITFTSDFINCYEAK